MRNSVIPRTGGVGMTAPLKWRSQLCPCGFCPDGTRVEWRYRIDIRFRPRRKVRDELPYPVKGDER